MKTLISKTDQFQIIPFVFLLLSFIFSGSALFPRESNQKEVNPRNKKLEILEKLESGKPVSSEEITSSFADFNFEDPEPWEFRIPEMNENILPGPFFYKDYQGNIRVIISDCDVKEIHKRLSESLEELRKNIESFRNSDDFLIMQDELKKWNENFRKEIEKMREDLLHSDSGTRSKGTVQSLM
jgi:hypothetical protein